MARTKTSGALLATAAAALLLSGGIAPLTAQAEDAKVACLGVHHCTPPSGCATASNGCKGQNACKGQGMKAMTEADCTAAGGTVKAE